VGEGSRLISVMQMATALSITPRAVRLRMQNAPRARLPGRGAPQGWPLEAFPLDWQARYRAAGAVPAPPPTNDRGAASNQSLHWELFRRKPERIQAIAGARVRAVEDVCSLAPKGVRAALRAVAKARRIPWQTLNRWYQRVRRVPRSDWAPALAPSWSGGGKAAECSRDAWEFFVSDYLRAERPALSACYERLRRAAAEHGWVHPSIGAMRRRLAREVPRRVRILGRFGAEAHKETIPHQIRDRSGMRALEAVNADGHIHDNLVRFPDGDCCRPVTVFFMDLYSNKILAWRTDKTESAGLVRLAFGDVLEKFGIPERAYIDNGRAFASKWMTGRMPTRYRFKVKEDEPEGLFSLVGTKVTFQHPGNARSKPQERAHRDLCESVAKSPKLAGSWTGNCVGNKPDYEASGIRAVDLALFERVLAEEIAAHNARPGRRTPVAAGRSFQDVFAESYAASAALIRRPTQAQRALWMLAAESVTASRRDGSIELFGNVYWSETLAAIAGDKVTVRFDPERLHGEVQIYAADGRFLGTAECREAAGFGDVDKAREYNRWQRAKQRADREALAAARKMDALLLSELLPGAPDAAPPAGKVVRGDFRKPLDEQREQRAARVENLQQRLDAFNAALMADIEDEEEERRRRRGAA
jgi:hypothetical protein